MPEAAMSIVETSTVSTKNFQCPKTGHVETAIVKNVSLAQQDNSLRPQSITRPATYPIITDCTGLKTCGIKKTLRSVVTFSWKDCPFNTTLKTR